MLKNYILKFKNLPSTAKAAACFTLCNLFLKGINFLTTPLFTRVMSEYEYGTLSIFISYEQFFLILATWEIAIGAYQKGIFKYKDTLKEFTLSTQLLGNVITIVFFAVLFCFRDFVYKFTEMDTEILLLLFGFLLFQPAYNNFIIRKQSQYEYLPVIAITMTFTLLNVLVPLIALMVFEKTAKVKFQASLFVSMVIFVCFYVSNLKEVKVLKNKLDELIEYWKFIISFQLPLVLHSLSYLVLGQADRVMIGKMVGNVEAGFYSIAYTVASILTIVQNSINQVLVPWCYRNMEEKKYGVIRKNTSFILIGVGILALGAIFVSPEVMKILFSEEYYEAIWSIPPVTVGVYFVFLYSVFVNIETYFSKTNYVMYVSIICGILNVILNYLLIDVFGYIVCGYTTMVSYIAFAIGHYYFMRKICAEKIPGVSLFDIKKIVFISFCVMLIACLIVLLYPYWMIRYGILLCVLIGALVNRKKLLDFVKIFLAR